MTAETHMQVATLGFATWVRSAAGRAAILSYGMIRDPTVDLSIGPLGMIIINT